MAWSMHCHACLGCALYMAWSMHRRVTLTKCFISLKNAEPSYRWHSVNISAKTATILWLICSLMFPSRLSRMFYKLAKTFHIRISLHNIFCVLLRKSAPLTLYKLYTNWRLVSWSRELSLMMTHAVLLVPYSHLCKMIYRYIVNWYTKKFISTIPICYDLIGNNVDLFYLILMFQLSYLLKDPRP